MNYTSYFGNIKNVPKCVVPIAICGMAPYWYRGKEYKKLAPSWDIYSEWKYKKHDDALYTARFNEEILGKLDPAVVMQKLRNIAGGKQFCLMCYEKPGDFCHRHLVAAWLTKAGYTTVELRAKPRQ